MKIEKYQGCGNDFIISETKNISSEKIKKLCHRQLGFGADGLIYFNKANNLVKFFNADGSHATVCGNGLRCLGNYLFRHRLFSQEIIVRCENKEYLLTIVKKNPIIIKVDFPLNKPVIKEVKLLIDNKEYIVFLLNVGNDHAVLFNVKEDEDIAHQIVNELGDININFVNIISNEEILVKTFERGVGFTFSCGSGSLASVIVANYLQLVNQEVKIKVSIGELKVSLDNAYSIIGSAEFIYRGDNDEKI